MSAIAVEDRHIAETSADVAAHRRREHVEPSEEVPVGTPSVQGGEPVAALAGSEMIQDGVTGWILPRGDWEGMGRAASDLLNDPGEYRRLSDAIRRNAELLTDERQLYAHEEAAFERLLAS